MQGYRTTQKELQKNWNALDLARSQTPNALDLPAHKRVSLTGDVLGRIDNSIEGKERTIGEYTDDMSYVKDKTQSYEDYTRFVQAAMGDEYKGR